MISRVSRTSFTVAGIALSSGLPLRLQLPLRDFPPETWTLWPVIFFVVLRLREKNLSFSDMNRFDEYIPIFISLTLKKTLGVNLDMTKTASDSVKSHTISTPGLS